MNVKKYSKKKHGNKTVPGAPHFKIKEFACNDGSDAIYIDVDLAKKLEKIRVHFNKPAHINSGYRPPNYNLKVGGASNSYHTKGRKGTTRRTTTQSGTSARRAGRVRNHLRNMR